MIGTSPPRPMPWMKRNESNDWKSQANAQAMLIRLKTSRVTSSTGVRPQRSANQPATIEPTAWPA